MEFESLRKCRLSERIIGGQTQLNLGLYILQISKMILKKKKHGLHEYRFDFVSQMSSIYGFYYTNEHELYSDISCIEV